MKNWRRDDWFDETGLPWANPSPNMRNMLAATRLPGHRRDRRARTSRSAAAPIRRSSRSARRGSTAPRWPRRSTRARLAGVRFYPVTFTPAAGAKLGGQVCHGVFMIVTDRDRLRPVRVGLEIAAALSRLYGAQFKLEDAASLFGSKSMLEKIRAGEDPAAIAASWAPDEARGASHGRSICCTESGHWVIW